MKQHKLSDVIFIVITITFLVVHDVLALVYFIYYCVTISYNIEDIVLLSIAVFFTVVTINFIIIAMMKDLLNK